MHKAQNEEEREKKTTYLSPRLWEGVGRNLGYWCWEMFTGETMGVGPLNI